VVLRQPGHLCIQHHSHHKHEQAHFIAVLLVMMPPSNGVEGGRRM
jgi:hypothetical protein